MNATPYEQLPFGEPPSVDNARLTLVGDFYASFKFSQGAVDVQKNLFTLLSTTYSKLWTPEGMRQIIPDAVTEAQPFAEQIKPPSSHQNMEPVKVSDEATKQWGIFSEQLQSQATAPPLSSLQFSIKSVLLRRGLPLWDMRQVVSGRYNRDSNEATRESLYRKHVLDGQPTRSQAFDIIFASLRKHQLRHTPNIGLVYLKAGWEMYHKDEEFYPDSYRAALKEGPLYARVLHASPSVTLSPLCKTLLYIAGHVQKPRQFQQNKKVD